MLRAVLLLGAGVLVGLLAGRRWSGPALGPCPPLSCGPCETARARERERLQRHAREAQGDWRRCLAAHRPDTAAALRRGEDPSLAFAPPAPSSSSSSSSSSSASSSSSKRARLLLNLPSGALVPRPEQPVDVVFAWINGSDPVWRFAANAASPARGAESAPDNGALLHALRSLVKYGSALRIGTVWILASNGQRPAWLQTVHPAGLPHVRVMGDAELGNLSPVFSSADLWARLPMLTELSDEFLLWPDGVLLGAPAHREDFWRSEGGWGPRIFLQSEATVTGSAAHEADSLSLSRELGHDKSTRRPAPAAAPMAMSRPLLSLMLEHGSGWQDLRFAYAHWVVGHGLAGSHGEPGDLYHLTARQAAETPLPAVMRALQSHLLVAFSDGGSRLSAFEQLMATRWPFATPYEAVTQDKGAGEL